MYMNNRRVTADHLRNFVFGVEDSLVSTVGLVSGIAIVGTPVSSIILTGAVLVFVEAFSMSVGSLLSDNSAREFEEHAIVPLRSSVTSSVIMFVSYFLAGFVVLLPYLFTSGLPALYWSIGSSLFALFVLGLFSGRVASIDPVKKGLTMMIVGGIAIGVGMIVGTLVSSL
jgi:VIT1/CCC1 family predicted Fe2+/Mn2+ transporter